MSAGDDLFRQMGGGGAPAPSRFHGTPTGAVRADGFIPAGNLGAAGFIPAFKNSPAPSSGGSGFFGSLVHGAEDLGYGVAAGTYNLGRATVEDLANPVNLVEHPGRSHLWNEVAKPIGESYAKKYGAVFEHPLSAKSWETVGSNIVHDPVGSTLDALTLASAPFTLGESAAVRGATLLDRIAPESALAAKAAKVAEKVKAPIVRDVKIPGTDIPVSYSVKRARTPLGRLAQRGALAVGERPELFGKPLIGAQRHIVAGQREAEALTRMAVSDQIAQHERSIPLNRAEQAAYHIIAQAPRNVAREDWLRLFHEAAQRDLATAEGAKATSIQAYLSKIGHDSPKFATKIQKAVTDPSERLLRSIAIGREVMQSGAKDLGIPAATSAERAARMGDFLAGTKWDHPTSVRVPGSDAFATDRQAMTREARQAERQYQQAVHRHASLRERVRSYQGRLERAGESAPGGLKGNTIRARKALAKAQNDLATAKQRRDFLTEGLKRVPSATPAESVKAGGEFVGPTAEHLPQQGYKAATDPSPFGDPFVFPHSGRKLATPTAGISRAYGPLGQIQKRSEQYLNRGIRHEARNHLISPSVIGHSRVNAYRFAAARRFQDWLGNLSAHVPENGIIPPGWVAHEPTASKLDRIAKEQGANIAEMGHGEADKFLQQHFEKILPAAAGESKMMVPEWAAKTAQREFTLDNRWVRNLYDKPLDVWRALVLKYRPAWLVNNIVGQHFLYALHAGGIGGLRSYLGALRTEKGPAAEKNAIQQALKIPQLESSARKMLRERGLSGVTAGTTQGFLGDNERYITSRRAAWKESNPKVYTTAAALPRLVKNLGDVTAYLNQKIADDLPRTALYTKIAREGRPGRAAQAEMRATAQAMGRSLTLSESLLGPAGKDVIRQVTPEEHLQILREMNDALGNFNNLGPLERRYMRRIFPFVSWFKVIAAISKNLVVDHPEKVLLMNNLEKAAKANPGLFPRGQMPPWLRGAFALSPEKNDVQSLLSTMGINPFGTPVQLGQAAAAPFAGGRASDTLGLFGPAFQAYDLFQGINPLTGNTYTGAGAKSPPAIRAAEGFLTGLPQVQLAQHFGYLGGAPQSKLYANTPRDYLWNYLGYPIKKTRISQANQYGQTP